MKSNIVTPKYEGKKGKEKVITNVEYPHDIDFEDDILIGKRIRLNKATKSESQKIFKVSLSKNSTLFGWFLILNIHNIF